MEHAKYYNKNIIDMDSKYVGNDGKMSQNHFRTIQNDKIVRFV